LGGTNADAVTWYDVTSGGWQTSSAYPVAPFVEDFAKAHPVAADYGKTWMATLPASAYLYDATAVGAKYAAESGPSLPHPLHGAAGSTAPDKLFYLQWQASPYADTYLVNMANDAVDKLGLGQRGGTDFLGVSFSSPDYVGHAFGPRSWEIQDVLAQLDRDLGVFFAHLDQKVGRGTYVVALTADHGKSAGRRPDARRSDYGNSQCAGRGKRLYGRTAAESADDAKQYFHGGGE
jgi:hypothetical protein